MHEDERMLALWKIKAVKSILTAFETSEENLDEDVCFLLIQGLNDVIEFIENDK